MREAGLYLALGCLAGVAAVGCGNVKKAIDCETVCDWAADCLDSSLSASKCIDRCFDKVDDDPDLRQQADICGGCVEAFACLEAVDECKADCDPVLEAAIPGFEP